MLLGAHWLIEGNWGTKFRQLTHNYPALIFIGLYVLNVAGMLYTTDVKPGAADLETKLAILVMPLVLGSVPPIGNIRVSHLCKVFVAVNTAAALFCVGGAIYHYFFHQTNKYFFYHDLSGLIGMHAIYFSMYLSFCLFTLTDYLVNNWYRSERWLKWTIMMLMGVLFGVVILLSSKTILLSLLLFLSGFCIFYFLSNRKHWVSALLIIAANAIVIFALLVVPYTRERFRHAFETDFQFMREGNYDIYYTGLSLRVVIWKLSVEIVRENNVWLAGVGTGDSQAFLDDKYRQYHLYTGNKALNDNGYLGYNGHNQYIQFLLCLGIVGLLYFILYLGIPAWTALRRRDYLFLAFVLFFAICCLTESILCRQKGVVFYALFSALFMFHRFLPSRPSAR